MRTNMAVTVTREQLERVESGRKEQTDPCVICGSVFNGGLCEHTLDETEALFIAVQNMSQKEKDKLRQRTGKT